jgi:rhodanese-related sulfurtransferase
MKSSLIASCFFLLAAHLSAIPVIAAESEFEVFLGQFDYEMRDEMKIDSKGLIPLLSRDEAILVDVRFSEEVSAWHTGFGVHIPLNELPRRLQELPKNKTIVAACPHKDRSAIAMAYLRSKGYDAKYLTDGLIGLAEQLRGERAKDFMESLHEIKSAPKKRLSKEEKP